MAAPVPQKLQTIAIIQLVSGLVNFMFMGFTVTSILFTVLGTGGGLIAGCTAWICPLTAFAPCAGFCGFWGLGLLPIGILEMVCGGLTLMQPDTAKNFVKIGMYTELASLLFGGIPSFVAGMVVRSMVSDPEVAGFLESGEV